MSDIPHPLTPALCDLRDFAFMPLDVRRLRDSDMAANESPEVCWSAVLLWAAAWHQVPAGSLPDNDRTLAGYAGFGRVVAAWLEVREGALRHFIKCTDGRLYHPVVSAKAREAWRGKLEQRWRTECARIKKANQRTGDNKPFPTFEEYLKTLSPGTWLIVPGDSTPSPEGQRAMSPECPHENDIQGTGKGTGNIEEANASLSPEGDETVDGTKYPEAFEAVWKAYPHFKGRSAKRVTYGLWRRLSQARRTALPSAIARYAREGREPKAPCGAPAMEKWLERELDLNWTTEPDGPASAAPSPFPGPADLRARIAAEKGEGWTRTWLDQCGWRDVPAKVIVAPLAFTADTLRRELELILSEAGVSVLVEPRARSAA